MQLVQEAKNRQTKTVVRVLDHRDRDDLSFDEKWETVCCNHSTTCSFETKREALRFAASPVDWCGNCAAQLVGVTEMFYIGLTYTADTNATGSRFDFTCCYTDGDVVGFACGEEYCEAKIKLSANGVQKARVVTFDERGSLWHTLCSATNAS